jgi:hypothetical protein
VLHEQQNGYTSTTSPPPKLKIGDVQPPKRQAQLLPITPQLLPIAPQLTTPTPFNSNGFPGYPPYPPYAYPPPFHMPPSVLRSDRRYDLDIPSSDPIEELEDVKLFPRLVHWLQDLDDGPRGTDRHNFAQFGPDFEREKYFRICDLEDISVATIMSMCSGIAQGTASKLLGHAKKDAEAIRKKEIKRIRQTKTGQTRYP